MNVGHRQHFFLHPLGKHLAASACRWWWSYRRPQTGHQDDRWRLGGQIEPGVAPPISSVSSRCTTPTKSLARGERTQYFRTDGLFFDPGDEILDHRQNRIGLQQGRADFPQGIPDVLVGEAGLAAQSL